jgi:zinc protease
MIAFQEHTLSSKLKLIIHEDKSTPLVVVNLLYKVGSRNEHFERTGFAHLFEHLMFGGSKNVPDYDKVLHNIGAENNAFTNTDITNYYIVLNAENIETAFWVESDRMRYLTLDQHRLDTQKKVVVEEFKQRYLNVPYGDVWLSLRPLAYKVHPYRWPTIGMKPEHIESSTIADVQQFYDRHYTPGNAVLTVAGNVNSQEVFDLAEKWFGGIDSKLYPEGQLPKEPKQKEMRAVEMSANVPLDAIYIAYHMPARGGKDYVVADLLADLLGRSKSSRLYQSLVKEKQIFNSINAYITGSADPGLLVISGKINAGQDIHDAEKFIIDEIEELKSGVKEEEIEKVINQSVSSVYFSETELLNKAIALSMADALGDVGLVNQEIEFIKSTSDSEIMSMAKEILNDTNSSTLYYKSNNT